MIMVTHPAQEMLATTRDAAPRVMLLGTFEIRERGRPVRLPMDSQRLIAFLALRRTRMLRSYVAGTLWIEGSQTQAFGSLRSALWRLRAQSESLLESDSNSLALSPHVSTDLQDATAAATRLRDRSDLCDTGRFDIGSFTDELLPGWYDEWVVYEREQIRQQSLHALEAIAARLADEGQFAGAIEAALSAIHLDPLRESAHRLLINIHISEGNRSEAIRHFRHYEDDLRERLGIAPSERMMRLITC